MRCGRAETRRSGVRVAGNAISILKRRNRGNAREKRCAKRQQVARSFQGSRARCVLVINPNAIAANGKRWARLVHKLPDTGLAAFRIDNGLRKHRGLALHASRHSLLQTSADGVKRTLACNLSSSPFELFHDPLEEIVGHNRVKIDRRGLLPFMRDPLSFCPCLAKRAAFAVAHKGADHCMRCRQDITALCIPRTDHGINETNFEGSFAINRAPAQNQIQRIAHTNRTIFVRQQTWQALRAAIARQQSQSDFRLAKPRSWLGNAVMTRKREFHPAAKRNTLNRSNAWLAHIFYFAEGKLRVVWKHHSFVKAVDFLEHLPDVSACNKG